MKVLNVVYTASRLGDNAAFVASAVAIAARGSSSSHERFDDADDDA